MRLYDNEAYRDTFMQGVYGLLEDDPTNERANAIIELFDSAPAVTLPNEPLTCEGCYWQTHGSIGKCVDCIREKTDHYRRPPDGEEAHP